jgi:hypothetical protein
MAAGEVYDQTARRMLDAAAKGKPLKSILKTDCPWIESQLRQSANPPGLLRLWGRSLNFDENTNTLIVEPAILRLIGELAGVPLKGRIVHAGLEHTYGYLFSLIETPYGKKRDRWIQPDLDQGFGFQVPTLRDRPDAGTLLLNLTFCLAQIAFRDHAVLLERLQMESACVSSEVRDYAFDELRIRRVVEQAIIPEGRRQGVQIELRTDFVTLPFASPSNPEQRSLLVYSIINGPRLGPQLITAFPVASTLFDEITAPENLGDQVQIRTRYNAYVEGFTGRLFFGRRFLVD